jgi:hypothetical protein
MEKAIELFKEHLAPHKLPIDLFAFAYSCHNNAHTLYVTYTETNVRAEYFHIGQQLVRNYNTFIDLKLIAKAHALSKEIEILKQEISMLRQENIELKQ